MKASLRLTSLLTIVSAGGLSACGGAPDGAPGANEAPTGTIEAAITSAPTGVACLSVTLTGSTSTSQKFALTSGQSTILSIGALAAGVVNVNAAAYSQACTSVTTTTAPTWISVPTSATVTVGIPTSVSIVLRPVIASTGTVSFAPAAIAIAAGFYGTAAVLEDGTVRAWGLGAYGASYSPSAVAGITGATSVAVSTSGNHACALAAGGAAYCWGNNSNGQLGNGTTTSSATAVKVSGSYSLSELSLGNNHSCAIGLAPATHAICWGQGNMGQLMNISTSDSSTPVIGSFTQGSGMLTAYVAAGPDFTCIVNGGGTTYCFGNNGNGEFGNGQTTPGPITSFSGSAFPTASLLSASSSVSCALLVNGTVACAGLGSNGQLGNGSTSSSSAPVVVSGLSNVTSIKSGAEHVCALRGDGTVWCWGLGAEGQLGNAQVVNAQATPAQVPGLTGVTAISSGGYHTCALKNDGTMWCWGDNTFGEIGDGTIDSRFVPVQVQF